jgi:leucyl-tRNA synthetase
MSKNTNSHSIDKSANNKLVDKLKPSLFEDKWRQYWLKSGTYQPDMKSAKNPFYNLMMFPYPSAEGLHVGNMYAFTGVDIYGRFMRMKGYDVFEPIGLDGFGIHSENYALKVGKNPREQAEISEKNFYRQLGNIGNGFAWGNRLETYDPDYYRWTQWIFIQMFKHGLAYRKKSAVNFCPSCKTVLSDEQVIDGKCERCKSEVEKRNLEQWFFKITEYAGKLLDNTYKENFKWSEKVKIGQQNWIGRKMGINISYTIVAGPATSVSQTPLQFTRDKVKSSINSSSLVQSEATFGNPSSVSPAVIGQIVCFTTRPDTNFGATFVVIAPEHEFVNKILESRITNHESRIDEIKDYVEKAKAKSEADRIAEGREKTGVFTGFYCVNNLNGYRMPLYISDFVLSGFGTGAVVGVPGHDRRDFEFAQKFRLPVIRVVVGKDGDDSKITKIEQVQEEEGKMVNSEFLDGLDIHDATKKMMDHLEEKRWGKRVTTYRLRDWCISRQRYWGAPIPMISCPKCGWVSVPEEQLPVLLPDLADWKPEGTGKGPLAKLESFVKTKCPKCRGEAQRETDVCDTFLDSSWYFLRYPSINAGSKYPFDPEITKKWLPVNMYIGGAEHTVLHLLYSRFVTMVLHDLGYLEFEEPYIRFYAHGLIIAEGAKMSKSRGNVIIPDEYIAKYGADTLRTYLMFLGPFDAGGDFRDTGIAGMYKFLNRVWRITDDFINSKSKTQIPNQIPNSNETNLKLDKIMHHTIREVTKDLENLRYNTAISHVMEYVNELQNYELRITKYEYIKTLLLLLAPFAPFMTEELWSRITNHESRSKNKKEDIILNSKFLIHNSIHKVSWPTYDPKYLVEDEVTIVVQVNGKLRDNIKFKIQNAKVKSEVELIVLKSEKVKKHLEGKKIIKTIYVSGKLINFVVS